MAKTHELPSSDLINIIESMGYDVDLSQSPSANCRYQIPEFCAEVGECQGLGTMINQETAGGIDTDQLKRFCRDVCDGAYHAKCPIIKKP